MPLVKSVLEKNLLDWASNKKTYLTGAQSAAAFIDAYDLYAKAAISGGASPASTDAGKAAFVALITAAIASPIGVPGVFEVAMAAGLSAYWNAIIWSPANGGPCTTLPPGPVPATVTPLLLANATAALAGADDIAYTKGVANALTAGMVGVSTITILPTPAPPLILPVT